MRAHESIDARARKEYLRSITHLSEGQLLTLRESATLVTQRRMKPESDQYSTSMRIQESRTSESRPQIDSPIPSHTIAMDHQ